MKTQLEADNSNVGLLAGKGPNLLLLPGFGCGHRIMLPLVETLVPHLRVLVTDHRGMGDRPAQNQYYSFEDLVADNWLACERANMAELVIAGTSMGGLLAQVMALQVPSRVRGLILMCTLSTDPSYRRPEDLNDDALRELFERPDYPEVSIRSGVADDFPTRSQKHFEALLKLKESDRAKPEQAVLQAQAFRIFMEQPLNLAAIACPVLIMTGQQDRIVHPSNSGRLQTAMPHAQLHCLENTGHLFFLEEPEKVANIILQFMENL